MPTTTPRQRCDAPTSPSRHHAVPRSRPSVAPIVVGIGSLTCVATLTGATSDATGTITFNRMTRCALRQLDLHSTARDRNVSYTSDPSPRPSPHLPLDANYSCDANNNRRERLQPQLVGHREPAVSAKTHPLTRSSSAAAAHRLATLSGATEDATGTKRSPVRPERTRPARTSIFRRSHGLREWRLRFRQASLRRPRHHRWIPTTLRYQQQSTHGCNGRTNRVASPRSPALTTQASPTSLSAGTSVRPDPERRDDTHGAITFTCTDREDATCSTRSSLDFDG